MTEIKIDRSLNEVKVIDNERSFVIKEDNLFHAWLYNEHYVCVSSNVDTSDEKTALYDLEGRPVYVFYNYQSKVEFMGRELKTDIEIISLGFYPIKKTACGLR